MIKIRFKNLKASDLVHEAAVQRIESVAEKFEQLKESRIQVTLEMENSPAQAGPDFFSVKVYVRGGLYDGVRISKSAASLYIALADVVDHLLEVLNRYSDKKRVKSRSKLRRLAVALKSSGLPT